MGHVPRGLAASLGRLPVVDRDDHASCHPLPPVAEVAALADPAVDVPATAIPVANAAAEPAAVAAVAAQPTAAVALAAADATAQPAAAVAVAAQHADAQHADSLAAAASAAQPAAALALAAALAGQSAASAATVGALAGQLATAVPARVHRQEAQQQVQGHRVDKCKKREVWKKCQATCAAHCSKDKARKANKKDCPKYKKHKKCKGKVDCTDKETRKKCPLDCPAGPACVLPLPLA